jgi:hypothetical protein
MSTPAGREKVLTYVPRISHETFWAPADPISVRVAVCTWAIFVGATLLTSYVLRHLLLIGIEANIKIESTTNETNITIGEAPPEPSPSDQGNEAETPEGSAKAQQP